MVVDADVIIRFLTGDDSEKAHRFEKFLLSERDVFITDVTFAEIYWTLKSFYKFGKNKILLISESLLNTPSVVSNKDLLLETISIMKGNNLSFIDAYVASFSFLKDDGKILSFDRGFDKLKSVAREEP